MSLPTYAVILDLCSAIDAVFDTVVEVRRRSRLELVASLIPVIFHFASSADRLKQTEQKKILPFSVVPLVR